MSVARHPRPPELVDVPIEDIMQKYVGRFREKKPDWAATTGVCGGQPGFIPP